jgi:hypothetical protein
MKSLTFESREAWLNWRLGKATGSTLKEMVNLRDGGTKPGVYRAAAESLIGPAAIDADDDEKAMERGIRLEPVASRRRLERRSSAASLAGSARMIAAWRYRLMA